MVFISEECGKKILQMRAGSHFKFGNDFKNTQKSSQSFYIIVQKWQF